MEVVWRQGALYHVEAKDAESAERLALTRWQEGDEGDVLGFEGAQLESVHSSEAPDLVRQSQDEQLVLRFIRERERLLIRLGGDLLSASISDAISASQAAADLGWLRSGKGEERSVDVVRAAESLERLCASKLLVCFERERVRAGERGAVRLYCTPEYLERLSHGARDFPDHSARA